LLRWRFIFGTVFVAALVGLCWLDAQAAQPGTYLLPLAILLSLLSAGELLVMFRKRGHDPLAWVVYCGALITVLAAGLPSFFPPSGTVNAIGSLSWLALGLAASLLLALVGEMVRFREAASATANLALSFFAVAYVGGLLGFLVQLRLHGMFALLSMITVVKMSDTGQYTAGRLFGKNKLAPRISPGKTWEGAIGGIVFACVAVWIVFRFAPAPASGSILHTVAYAVALAVAGMIGDLAESLFKRDAGVKDSSNWLPGFGGVLDLLDSLLGAAPVAYLFWAMHWIG
jgi:phosphatidate cytidylyltransferase